MEKDIQRQIIEFLESENYYVIKAIVMSKRGFPDLIAVRHDDVMFIEVKAPKGIISSLQRLVIKLMRPWAFVARSVDDVREKINGRDNEICVLCGSTRKV